MRCFNCGANLVWQSDFMKSEYEDVEYDEDDDQVINVLNCPNCHTDVYCVHPSNNMAKEYEKEEQTDVPD